MDLELTPELLQLEEVADRFLDRHAPLGLARAFLDGDGEATRLHHEVGELGWFAVGLGDDPFGVPGLVLIAHSVGMHATPLPIVDAAVAARLAGATGADSGPVGQLAQGAAVAAIAAVELEADWGLYGLATTAEPSPAGPRVSGVKLGVSHGATAKAFAVMLRMSEAPAVVFVDAGAEGVSVEPAAGVDPSAAPATVTFDRALASPEVLTGPDALRALSASLAVGAVACAAEGLGAASAALELAVAYARERHQFGRPIGRFQAVQHLLADAYVRRETAWSTILYAAAALEESRPDAAGAAHVAKAYAARASRDIVETAIQAIGGIAFTREHDVHLLQRRVLSCERRYGDALDHEAMLGDLLAGAAT